MRVRMKLFGTLVFAAMIAGGCGAPAATTTTPANASSGAGPAGDAPAEAKVVCHLSCSGTEATESGATEEEARDAVSQHIDTNCKPEDGQYFVFCDAPAH